MLNSLLRMSNIDVYVTGSNSKFLSSDIVTEFRGRGDEIRIYPFSFAEFYSVYDGEYDDAWDDYMIYGGLPQVVGFQSERQKADYLKNIFANVYLKDVIERNKIQNVDEIGILVDVGIVQIFDKDKEGKRVRKQLEVDFVVNQGNQRYYIQVAYDMTSEEKQTQEFNSLRNIPDSFKKIVIVNGSKKPWRNDEGFVIMGMKYFLLNADSLEF